MTVFDSVLIANRGEIACRVIRTARAMGLRTVAVFSDADRDALHVRLADDAVGIGPAPARESYLSIPRILDAARRSGAGAIHPGYGFLSENAEFAEACAAAELVFIGPPAGAIRAMGSKSAAKALMERAGVPLVPGYHGENQDPALLADEAGRIGYPVLIKASAGGGGKGMRVVERAEEFAAALDGAKREAAASFGDDRVLVERYLTRPRHIEMQVFADAHGNVVSLFERDCSIQRRHQKVIEEAPAPGMDPDRRRSMGEAACAAARAVGYVGAGTVEFIVDAEAVGRDGMGDRFYFMEMNTRLQVEHPVTEAITGLDLVEWQIRVARGESLPLPPGGLRIDGHAIEVRIYAEDPARGFLPATGTLRHLRFPAEDRHVRVDTGVRAGDAITIHYDPMIAKLIVWDQDRAGAVRRLRAALAGCEIVGVATNVGFLGAVAAHPDFAQAHLDTGFIARHAEALIPAATGVDDTVLAASVLGVLLDGDNVASAAREASADPWSPWNHRRGWRLNGSAHQDLLFRAGGADLPVDVHFRGDGGWRLDLPAQGGRPARSLDLDLLEMRDGVCAFLLDGVKVTATVLAAAESVTVIRDGIPHALARIDATAPLGAELAGGDRVAAPMPGRITQVLVAPGETVQRGAKLLVLEAMKMEHTLTAPVDGVVDAVRAASGDLVEEGTDLVTFRPAE